MTNEQLAVLLEQYRRMLQEAYDKIATALPGCGEKCPNGFGGQSVNYPALHPIYDVIEAMENDISTLTDGRA